MTFAFSVCRHHSVFKHFHDHCVMILSEFSVHGPKEAEVDMLVYKLLANICPIMFPFDVRRHLFKTFVLDKLNVLHLATKLTLKRTNVLEQMCQIINPSSLFLLSLPWAIAFDGEIGEGHGPNKELFTLISNEFQRHDLNLWFGAPVSGDIMTRGESAEPPQTYTYSPNGLFPKRTDWSKKPLFRLLGQLMAKAIVDGHLLDIPLSVEFFKYIMPRNYISKCYDIAKIVPESAKLTERLILVRQKKWDIKADKRLPGNKKYKLIREIMFDDDCSFDDLSVNFTMPGSGEELIEGGEDVMLNPSNANMFLNCMTDFVFNENLDEIRRGIEEVICADELSIFLPEELQSMVCGQEYKPWNVEYLTSCCEFANGYDASSNPVSFLFEVLSTFSASEQRQFLRFVSSSPRLPMGGLKNLRPRLTISRNSTEEGIADLRLPSASTCFNTLHLPEYSSEEKTREKLWFAMSEGDGSFQYV